MWRWKVYPHGWTGEEQPATLKTLEKTIVKDGEILGYQKALPGFD